MDQINREQCTSSRRQFITPTLLKEPVVSPETTRPLPPSQSTAEGKAGPDQLARSQVEPVWTPDDPLESLPPRPFFIGVHSDAPSTLVAPTSSPWMGPQSGQHASDLFAAPSNNAFQEEQPILASWTLPLSELDYTIRQPRTSEKLPRTTPASIEVQTALVDKTVVENKNMRWIRRMLTVPANFFSIPFGMVGLARVWQVAESFYHLPSPISDILYLATAVVFLLLCAIGIVKLVFEPKILISDLTHPVLGPFHSLMPITGMLLAVGLQPYAHHVAFMLFLIFFVATILLGGWMIGQWVVSPKLDSEQFHSGYFLPTVTGGLLCGDSAARFGLIGLGWVGFGIGIISWLMLGSITLNRLSFRLRLPTALIPTIATELAPPTVGDNAYFRLAGSTPDLFAYMLAGYAILMVLLQLRLLPLYRKLSFSPGFWAFTMPWAATVADALVWMNITHLKGGAILSYVLLAGITVLIGGIGIRSAIALLQGKFLPAS
jgi:tellurite resistance protein